MLGIPIEVIRQAKRDGCPAFRSGRVYIADLLPWLKSHEYRWAAGEGQNGSSDAAKERSIRLQRDELRLERERFEFEQLKNRMLPVSQFELALAKTITAFVRALDAFGPRINEKLEGLDYNGRAEVIEQEIYLLRKTLAKCDYLNVEEEEELHGA